MAIYEIKDTKPAAPADQLKRRRRDVKPVFNIDRIAAVSFNVLSKESGKDEKRDEAANSSAESVESEKSARTIIGLINEHFTSHNIKMHLNLIKFEGFFLLDIYDCTDHKVCRKVADLVVDITKLPIFLKKLKQEAGLLVDKKI